MSQDGATPGPLPLRLDPIRRQLEELPIAIANRTMRDFCGDLEQLHKGLPTLLANMVRIAGATWQAVCALTLDRQHGELPRREHATAVPPLARTLLESATTVVFIGEETNDRVNWYYRAGWREAVVEYKKREARYSSEAGWDAWSKLHIQWIESHDLDLKITPQEKLEPALATNAWASRNKQGFWPSLSPMQRLALDPSRKAFLGFVKEWSYAKLSQDSHLSYLGLARRAAPLAEGQSSEKRDIYRSHVCLVALSLYLALLSEVAAMVGMDAEKKRLVKVWEHLGMSQEAKELWDARYQVLLNR